MPTTAPQRRSHYRPAKEIAEHLGVSRQQVYDMVAEGKIAAIRIGHRIQISDDALAEFEARNRIKPAAS